MDGIRLLLDCFRKFDVSGDICIVVLGKRQTMWVSGTVSQGAICRRGACSGHFAKCGCTVHVQVYKCGVTGANEQCSCTGISTPVGRRGSH